MDDENTNRQHDEIEALKSIYEMDFHTEDKASRIYSIDIKEKNLESVLEIKLAADYPEKSPPSYTLSAPWLKGQSRCDLYHFLDEIYLDNIGESIIYQWVERIREFMLDFEEDDIKGAKNSIEETNESPQETNCIECPQIVSGQEFIDRKSVFQPHLARVSSIEEVQSVLNSLKSNKKIASATHNITSYRFRNKDGILVQEYEDDGEDRAGHRMLNLMQMMDVEGVLVVVTRWYGGVHLGPDRFKHINNLTRHILNECGFVRPQGKTNKKKSQKM